MAAEITYSTLSPADHCFRALQLLAGADRVHHLTVLETHRAVALRNSLELALVGLGRPIQRFEITDRGRRALESETSDET